MIRSRFQLAAFALAGLALAGTPGAAFAKSKKKTTATEATTPASGAAVFPAKIDAKYSKLSAGKAREKTCLDQYHANKAKGGNGGMTWIQKGGGYYSACIKHLKGT